MKNRPVVAELFHGRHDEAYSRFPQFCERTQNHSLRLQQILCSEKYTEHKTAE
jgi:hypothetical protein